MLSLVYLFCVLQYEFIVSKEVNRLLAVPFLVVESVGHQQCGETVTREKIEKILGECLTPRLPSARSAHSLKVSLVFTGTLGVHSQLSRMEQLARYKLKCHRLRRNIPVIKSMPKVAQLHICSRDLLKYNELKTNTDTLHFSCLM